MSTFAMHVAKTGLNSQQVKMQVIANNLANVNTTGFKSDRANFESLLYQILRGAGENTSENTSLTSGLSVGTGTSCLSHSLARLLLSASLPSERVPDSPQLHSRTDLLPWIGMRSKIARQSSLSRSRTH